MNLSAVHSGYLLSRHSRDTARGTQIILWLHTAKGPVKLIIEGEQPVFFIPQDEQHQVDELFSQAGIQANIKPLALKNFEHHAVCGVYFSSIDHHFRAKSLLLSAFVPLYEHDFRLHDRFLMERFVNAGMEFVGKPKQRAGYVEYTQAKVRPVEYRPSLSALSLDIECSRHGDLYSVGLYGDGVAEVLMIGEAQASDCNILWCADEPALLTLLEQRIAHWDPDIIMGWSVVNFDFRLLIKRAERYNKRLHLGRGGQPIFWRDRKDEPNQGFVTIAGRVIVDGIDGLKTMTYHFDSFSLENVAQALLGRGKDTQDVENRLFTIEQDFLHNKPKLAAYNLEDCRLVWDIYVKTRLLDFLSLRSHITGLELDRSGGSVAAFTNLYLPKLHRAGYIAPNLPEGGGLASPGGYVMDSRPGLYKHVLVLDFKSLYPSIIRTFKIDPLGLVEGLAESENSIPGFRGGCFSRDKHFLPDIITHLWQQRDEAKREGDEARSQAIKILMNSFYGVLGSGGCRFYDTRLASSITMRGHEIMQQTAAWIEAAGYQVIYGDTDSTFVWLDGNYSDGEADEVGKTLTRDINAKWRHKLETEFELDCNLELEYETHYRRFHMPTIRGAETGSKKRYAGIKAGRGDDMLVFKGLETVRSDWTGLAKHFQTRLYECIFSDQDPCGLIRALVSQTQAGEWDEALVYRKRLRRKLAEYVKNVPPHVKAARLADEKNRQQGKALQYQHKGWISYIITVNGPEPVEYQESAIDYQHYIDKQLKPIADGVLPEIGLDFDSLINAQMGLF